MKKIILFLCILAFVIFGYRTINHKIKSENKPETNINRIDEKAKEALEFCQKKKCITLKTIKNAKKSILH